MSIQMFGVNNLSLKSVHQNIHEIIFPDCPFTSKYRPAKFSILTPQCAILSCTLKTESPSKMGQPNHQGWNFALWLLCESLVFSKKKQINLFILFVKSDESDSLFLKALLPLLKRARRGICPGCLLKKSYKLSFVF